MGNCGPRAFPLDISFEDRELELDEQCRFLLGNDYDYLLMRAKYEIREKGLGFEHFFAFDPDTGAASLYLSRYPRENLLCPSGKKLRTVDLPIGTWLNWNIQYIPQKHQISVIRVVKDTNKIELVLIDPNSGPTETFSEISAVDKFRVDYKRETRSVFREKTLEALAHLQDFTKLKK